MLKRVFKLFQIARKFSTSGTVSTINEIHQLPTILNVFFNFISIGANSSLQDRQKSSSDRLCVALQGMGTTFIKLGQFLATRPDIIGEELAKSLEKLQDKVPAFDLHDAKKIIKKEIGEKYFKDIKELSEPIAAASIAQVHLAKIEHNGKEQQVAIKILRPDIEKFYNQKQLAELMLINGFSNVEYRNVSNGISAIPSGWKS